jgi:sugar lactone lactonase YvrE
MVAVDAPWAVRCDLGEGPYWDAAAARLSYVDIDAGIIHELDPTTGDEERVSVEAPISFAIPVGGGGRKVCGTGVDLTLLDAAHREFGRRSVEPDRPGNRFNDGKADPAGRLWCGTMSLSRTTGAAALYRLDSSGLVTVTPAVTISNGLDWDVERQRMYYIDSPTQRIDVFDFDITTGGVEGRRPFATIDPDDGLPDGMTLDADGGVWVALFGGAAVRRYDPDGSLSDVVGLPVTHPTCPVFGGPDLALLFVTTSRHKLTDGERAEQPLAGALLVIDAGVRGRPGNIVSTSTAAAISPAA